MDLIGLSALLAAGLSITLIAATWHTVRTLTRPPRRGYAYAVSRSLPGDPSELAEPLEFTEWSFESRGLSLPVWDIRGGNPAGPTVVFTHGWGESRVIALSRVPVLAAGAGRVVVWDLPGHGESPGRCSLGTREVLDLRALIGRVAEPGVPIVLAGSSMGGGVSIVAAVEDDRVVGVIAEAPYRVPMVPARNVLRGAGYPYRVNLPLAMGVLGRRFGYGLSWTTEAGAGGFDRARHAANLHRPLLVLHGDRDAVCPLKDGRTIAAAGNGRMVEVAGAEHLNLWTVDEFRRVCEAEVGALLAQVGRG